MRRMIEKNQLNKSHKAKSCNHKLAISLVFPVAILSAFSVNATGAATHADNVEYSLSASCNDQTATISYKIERSGSINKRLLISRLSYSATDDEVNLSIPVGQLPKAIEELELPYVQRVQPLCIEGGVISFVMFMASEKDLVWPQMSTTGAIRLLHFDIDSSGKLNTYVSVQT